MLDLAAGLTDHSRLSCQLEVTAAYEGAVVLVPGDGL
jgi:ferredoxin